MAQSSWSPPPQHSQQPATHPEDIWRPFIRQMYPNLRGETYCVPPIHFNRTPIAVEKFSGLTVNVRDKTSQVHSFAGPHADSKTGNVFRCNQESDPPRRVQDSDFQDDKAQESCVHALSNIPGQVMMVISQLDFRHYLDNQTNPERRTDKRHAEAIAQLPTTGKQPEGEFDVVVIHRQHGFLIGEVKAVGGMKNFSNKCPAVQNKIITEKVKRAVKQLDKEEAVVRTLVKDLPGIRITTTLMLPNVTSAQLRKALGTDAQLLQNLCQQLSVSTDVHLACKHCLCQDNLTQPGNWWTNIFTKGSDPNMSDDIYERLVARFCGPATTIPIVGRPEMVRSLGHAVKKTGLLFSALTLTRTQMDLLSRAPRFLHLEGPPGTGKTVVLLLKALQWARRGHQVIFVSGGEKGDAVTTLMMMQLKMMQDSASASIMNCNFHGGDVRDSVACLKTEAKPGPVLVVCDEVGGTGYSDRFIEWITTINRELPDVTCWSAGVYTMNKSLKKQPLPSFLEVQTLDEPLRFPPAVAKHLGNADEIRNQSVPQYSEPEYPLPTEGPSVQSVAHEKEPGHGDGYPQDCERCADLVYDVITCKLRVGQPDLTIRYNDVLILYGKNPTKNDLLFTHLKQKGLPVRVIPFPLEEEDKLDLALARTDEILVTEAMAVQGLERMVVIALNTEMWDIVNWKFLTQSRCNSALYIVE